VAVSSSQINLSWTASTDNVGVTGYKIYRNGTQVGTSNTVSYSDTGVSSNTSYSYSVAAYDAAGNTSAQSATASATTQTATGSTVFNCTGFAASGPCGVTFIWGDANNWLVTGATNGSTPALKGAQVNLIPGGAVHNANNLDYQVSKVNVQAFTTTFTFVPNGWNIALILNNSTNNPWGGNGQVFTSGAGCEGSFFQGFTQSQPAPPNNVFALELDQFSSLVGGGSNFTYSSAQIYAPGIQPQGNVAPGQSPCNPDLAGGGIATNYKYVGVDKISTSPVSLNAPASTINTTTRHTYSATITYDGSNLTLSLYDVTAGGSCPGTGCFTHTWSNINIPAIVGGNTAWVGLGGGTNESVPNPLLINSFSYSTGQPAGAQALSSPAAVTNTGTQTTTPTPTPTTAPTTVPTTAPAPTPTPTVVGIAVNSRVHTNTKANVRKSYSTSATRLGTQVAGSLGTVTQGPHLTSGYNWWFVDFDSGVDGWVRGDLLTQ
jgi:hypothetical protein